MARHLIVLLILLTAGCAAAPPADLSGPAYPETAAKLGSLDIEVIVGEQSITINSGIARDFGRVNVWLNQWFMMPIESLGKGERLTLPLLSFRNAYGAAPRVGGFFATRQRDEIVLAEIETEQGIYGLRIAGERGLR